MSGPSYEARREAEAALAARRDLGPEYDAQIAAGLAERVEQALWQQRAAGDQQLQIELARLHDDRRDGSQRFVLTILSLAAGIPITAISAAQVDPGLLGVGVSWAGIVGLNAVFALGQRRKRR